MKVRFIGFALESKCPMSFDNMFAQVESRHGVHQDAGDHKRLYYIDSNAHPDYYCGLVLTIKNQKKFCKLTQLQDGKTKISVENLKDHDSLMEFNFFVLHKREYIGLYQHYHQKACKQ